MLNEVQPKKNSSSFHVKEVTYPCREHHTEQLMPENTSFNGNNLSCVSIIEFVSQRAQQKHKKPRNT